MYRVWIVLLVVFVSAGALQARLPLAPGVPQTPRQKISLNVGWQYHRGDVARGAQHIQYDDRAWKRVNLPHTYQLTSINLDDCTDDKWQTTFHRDICWYRRNVRVQADPGQKVFLEFEGAHQLTEVWVNGCRAGVHAISAYTPFHFDITDLVKLNAENSVAIKLDNRKTQDIPPDGHTWDYVLFGGLYRDVYLVVTDAMYVTFPWEKREAGVFVTTPSVNARNATVSVRTTVRNTAEVMRSCSVVTRVLDANDTVVMKLSEHRMIAPKADLTCLQTGGIVEDMHLWSPDDPYLYRVNTQIVDQGQVVDMVENPLGLRWFELRPGVGFVLNGEPMELVGANRHQHYPYIGDAVPNNLHWNDAIKFKRAGMNIVRLAHYPHDNAFFDACDELGILVCEEPPSWIEFGPPVWMDRLEESFRRTIRNHRNHPCVWGWGAGVNHRGPLKRLHYASKQEDPTRITMNNGTLWTGPQDAGITDLYAVMDYRGAVVPEGQFLFAMEHSGSTDTIGHQRITSRYKAEPARIGLALWSAHDCYSFMKRGKQYPNLSRWSAAVWDIFRTPKPAFYWFQTEMKDSPMVHIADDRAQKDGSITVFSNCDEVELLLNGQSLGRRGPEKDPRTAFLNAPSIAFPVDWTSGVLTAKGWVDGKVVATHSRRQAGAAHHLELRLDSDCLPLYADGSSILMAYAHVCDAYGSTVVDQNPSVTFSVNGPARIVSEPRIKANPVIWERGIAPVLIQVGERPGLVTVTARADGLDAAQATAQTIPWVADQSVLNARPILEPLRLRVDLGNLDQHVQEEFTPWRVAEGNDVSTDLLADAHEAVTVRVSARETPLAWTSSWGVPGDLSFMIEDGVTTDATGDILLSFKNLPAGAYRLKTWHHRLTGNRQEAPRLSIRIDDALGENRLALADYQPTFGRKIQVSTAGGGNRGDGGSNLGAAGYALVTIQATGRDIVCLRFRAEAREGLIALNGFDLIESFESMP